MVMDIEGNRVKHLSALFVRSVLLPVMGKDLNLLQKVSDFNSNLMILYRIDGQMSNFLKGYQITS